MRFKVFLFLFFSALTAKSQVFIKANDPSIRYDLIQPGHKVLKTTAFDSLGKKLQDFNYECELDIKIDKNAGQIAFVRATRDITSHAQYIDTSFITIAPASLITPVRMHSLEHPARKELHVDFEPSRVIVHSLIGGINENRIYPMDEGYFDDNILVEELFGYLPIKKGIKYQLEGFRFESVKTNGKSVYEMEYLYDDDLEVGHDNHALCRVLSYKNDYCEGVAWFDQASGEILKSLIKLRSVSFLITYVTAGSQ